MRLRVLSDLRVEFATFEPPPLDVNAVVLAGDISLGPGECGLPQPPT